MKGSILYIDPVAGAAGDMICAALVSLGADMDRIRQCIDSLPLEGVSIDTEPVQRGPFAALRFVVHEEDAHKDHHPHRTWRSIRQMLETAPLAPRVKTRALQVFAVLAEAEGSVHGVDAENVTFHEVGAVDSIVDIVAAAMAMELLNVERMVVGPLPIAHGTIKSQHGPIPLPAPATLHLLKGWPVRPGTPDKEQVTPTGAAIIHALGEPGPIPAMTIMGVGVGAGTRNPTDSPNVLRAILGQSQHSSSETHVVVLESQMDDIQGEMVPPLIDALLNNGAIDAICIPIIMKKGRPGFLIQALAAPANVSRVEVTLLQNGSTFGVRRASAERRVLDRWHQDVDTPWGPVRIKVGALHGKAIQASPEFEDCLALATANQIPVRTVYDSAKSIFCQQPPLPERP